VATTPAQQDAYELLRQMFVNYGLGTLAPKILDYVQQGYSSDTITLQLQETPEYKTRFAGNEKRRAAGLPVLSPAEYLSTENAYRQVMQAAGMPSGFYDDPSDFADHIANDRSPDEIKGRVDEYLKVAKNVTPEARAMFQREWGIFSDGDIAAFVMDQKRALPILQRQVDAIGISEAARKQALSYSAARAQELADQGVTADQAQQAYSQIAEATAAESRAAAAFGLDYSQTDAENELLTGSASAKRKRQQVESAFGAVNTATRSTKSRTALGSDTASSY
jgi:hypothetical protein